MMRIIIDGDGSPVKQVVIDVAQQWQIPVWIVTSIDHYTTREYPSHVEFIYVDKGADQADFKIVSLIQTHDILVTQDYGLASLVLGKATVLHHTGKEYTADNIETLLAQRFIGKKMRQAGKRTKGPKPFTEEQREIFREKLIRMLELKTTPNT